MEQELKSKPPGGHATPTEFLRRNRKQHRGARFDKRMIIGITAIALIPALWKLGSRSLWQDESTTAGIIALPWRAFWHVIVTREANMGLYYVLLKILRVLGTSEAALRSVSALAMVGTIPVVYRISRRLFHSRAAVATVIVLGTNPVFLGFGREARSYALVMFLASVSTLLFIRIWQDEPSLRNWMGYILVSTLAVHAHFFAIFVLVTHAAFAITTIRGRQLRNFVLSLGLVATLCIPLALNMLGHDVGQVAWIPKPEPGQLRAIFLEFTGGDAWRLAMYLAGFLLALSSLRARKRSDKQQRSKASKIALVAALFLGPIALAFAISYGKPIFLSRYMIICIPPMAILTGAGLSRVRWKPFFALAVAGFAFASVTAPHRFQPVREDWRGAGAIVAGHAHKYDAIVFGSPWTRWGVDYYAPRYGLNLNDLAMLYPNPIWTVFGPDRTLPQPQWIDIVRNAGSHPRLWIVIRNWEHMPWALTLALKPEYEKIEDHKLAGTEVMLYIKRVR